MNVFRSKEIVACRFTCGFALLLLISFTAGCGTNLKEFYFGDLFGKGSSTVEKNPDQLALEGIKQMQEKDYGDAVKAFQKLKEHFPYSKYAILAELKLGDAHFYNKSYPEAANAYEEFARLHPRNEVIPYVLYQIGMCHFLAFSTIDRDQSETRTAVTAFERVIQAFPDSEYARRAKKQLFECQKRIVAHEYYVGQFYYRLEQYASARDRLEKISLTYPQAVKALGYEEAVNKMLAESKKHADEGGKKPSIWSRIGF